MSDPTKAGTKPGHDGTVEETLDFSPRFDAAGLMPAIATDAATGEVLMLAWMNREALAETLRTGIAHYWSRSRGCLWRKGETSGNEQHVVEIRTDCDQDALWMQVEVKGDGVTCHTGRRSCFYRGLPIAGGMAGEERSAAKAVDGEGGALAGLRLEPRGN